MSLAPGQALVHPFGVVGLPSALVEDRLRHNRAIWSDVNADVTDPAALARWERREVTWGLFDLPEAKLGLLGPVAGLRVVELGAGTAYLSAALAVAGARPVAIDLSPHQLATARWCQDATGIRFPLVEANAELVPLASGAFDLVVSEYGAGPWCAPEAWVPEAARLLRPGGRLVFLTNSPLAGMCVPAEGGVAGDRLLRGPAELATITWPGGGTEHHPSHGDWIQHLRAAGLEVRALRELHPPSGAQPNQDYEIVTADWARRWPAEDAWIAVRPAPGGAASR